MRDITVVPCADAAAIAALHHATVTVAYRGFFPASSAPPTVAELRDIWTTRLSHPNASALAAYRDERVVGSVMARSAWRSGEGEIIGLHVLPAEWGKGIGSTLLGSALEVSRDIRKCPETVMRSARWRPSDLPGGGHQMCTAERLPVHSGVTPFPARAWVRRMLSPLVWQTWAWCMSRSTVAVASVLGISSSNPDGWRFELTATLRRS
jgi:GNAT superfamily N-acetyltransferase